MNELKKLTKSTIIYFLGTVGTKIVSFLLMPVYTYYIAPDQYGTYDLHVTFALLFSSFFFLTIWTGIMKFIFEQKNEADKVKVVYSGITIFVSSAILYLSALSCFGIWSKIEYLPGVLAYGFFLCLQELYGYLARAFGYNLRFAFSGIIATLCNATSNIILLALVGMDYKALYISYAFGIIIQCLILEYKLKIIPSFRRHYISKHFVNLLLRFSLPLCINELCYWFLTGYNRVAIKLYMDSAANGYYAVASRFGGILTIVFSCFSMAWQELAYGKYDKDSDTGKFYSDATNIYIKALSCGFMIMIPMIYVIFPFMINKQYIDARKLIPLSMLAALVSIMFTFLGNIISTYKKNGSAFISTFCACIVNIACIHLLMGRYGAQASNIALLIGYIISDLMRVKTIQKVIPYKLNLKMFFYIIPLIVITCLVFWYGGIGGNMIWFMISGVISLVLFRDILMYFISKLKKQD